MPMIEAVANHEKRFDGIIRDIRATDIPQLIPILETWIRNRVTGQLEKEEIQEILEAIDIFFTNGNKRRFFVAELNPDIVIGLIDCGPARENMAVYAITPNPAEIFNAYVAKEHRGGKGVGKALVNRVVQWATTEGYTELLLNSGPRYRFSGWPAWTRIFGKPITVAEDYYGEGAHAPVWSKILS